MDDHRSTARPVGFARVVLLSLLMFVLLARLPSAHPVRAQEVVSFSGRVYEGAQGVEPPDSTPLAGVRVDLYCSFSPYPELGDVIATAYTDEVGWYGLEADVSGCKVLHIRETNPGGYQSVGAMSVDGDVMSPDVIEYTPSFWDKTWTGNKFWDQGLPPGPDGLPDLIILDAEWELDEDRLLVHVRVENQGGIASQASDVYVELVQTGEGDTVPVPTLEPDERHDVSVTLPFPPELRGELFELFMEVDPGQRVEESDEENNGFWLEDSTEPWEPDPDRLADLVVRHARWELEEDQDRLLVHVQVENQGERRSEASQVYAELLPPEEGETVGLRRLEPGEMDDVSIPLPFPPDLRGEPFELVIEVDPGQQVEESDEGNNRHWLEGRSDLPPPTDTPRPPTRTPVPPPPTREPPDGGGVGTVVLVVIAVIVGTATLGGLTYALIRIFRGGPSPEPTPEPGPEPEPEEEPEEPRTPVLPFPPVRLLRMWLSQGATGAGAVLKDRAGLQAGSLYTLHLQIQPRGGDREGSSEAPDEAAAERLRVVLYAPESDFGFVPEPVYMALPGQGASSEVCYPIRARRAGHLKLRACIYYGNVLLQTALLEAGARDERGRGQAQPSISRVTDYVASMDPRDLRRLPQPRLNIFTNRSSGDSHWVGLFASGGRVPECFRTGMLHTFGATELAGAADELRSLLTDIQGRGTYHFAASSADPQHAVEQLERYMVRLAIKGHGLYNALFFSRLGSHKRAEALLDFEELLREPGIISVARCRADATTIPWAALYDLYLDANAPPQLCGLFKEQLLAGHDLLDRPARCRAQAGCPLPDEDGRTVCPFGFWGFLHLVEQPIQQVKPTTVDEVPPDLASEAYEQSSIIELAAGTQAELAVAYYPRLPHVDQHLHQLQALAGSSRARIRVEDERDKILKDMLRSGGSHLYYFYCHGEGEGRLMRLKLGPADQPGYLQADNLKRSWYNNWRGKPHSLVILNACESVAMVPERMGELMYQLRFLGSGGCVGTEIPVRTELASEVGARLVRKMLGGQCVGEAFLDIRRDLLRQYNPLGLAYTCHAPASLHLHTPGDCAWCRSHMGGESVR